MNLEVYEVCPKCEGKLHEGVEYLNPSTRIKKDTALKLKGSKAHPSRYCPKCDLKWNSPSWVAMLKERYPDLNPQ